MTARELELMKLKRLEELQKEKQKEEKLQKLGLDLSTDAVFSVTRHEDDCNYAFIGSLIKVVTATMTGLHELERQYPEAKFVIDAAFESYKEMREEDA